MNSKHGNRLEMENTKHMDENQDNVVNSTRITKNTNIGAENEQKLSGKTTDLDEYRTTVIKNSGDDRTTEVVGNEKTQTKGSRTTKIDQGDQIEDYIVGELLTDSSGESEIHFCHKADEIFVVKVYKSNYVANQEVFDKINQIKSPYVIKVIKSGFYKNRYYEILPFYQNGTLFDHIEKLSDDFIKDVVVPQLNEGLKAIHDLGIVHNDIKPHNIFLTNDKKGIVLGDFGISVSLSGRTYVTKTGFAFTQMYAAPEADEASSKMTDYFSVGMTLLHLGLKEDPFRGLSNHKVRMLLINYSQHIPEKIDDDLADLIAKLIKYNPRERIDYSGVKLWIDNHKVYRGARLTTINSISVLQEPYNFRKVMYTNTIELTEAMVKEWDRALKNLENGFVETVYHLDVDTIAEIKQYKHKHSLDEYLFYVLNYINPNLSFTYRDYQFEDFEGFISHLRKNYSNKSTLIVTTSMIEIVMKNNLIVDEVNKIVLDVFAQDEDDLLKVDLLLNYFEKGEKVYANGKIFASIKDFADAIFVKDLMPAKGYENLINNKSFQNLLMNKYAFDKNDIKTLINYKDTYTKLAFFSKRILGYVPLKHEGLIFKVIDDFVVWSKNKYESHESLAILGKYIIDGYLEKFMKLYDDVTTEDIKRITNIRKLSDEPELLGAYFYTDTVENSLYYLKGKKPIADLKDLLLALRDNKKIIEISELLMYDDLFAFWFKNKGYEL